MTADEALTVRYGQVIQIYEDRKWCDFFVLHFDASDNTIAGWWYDQTSADGYQSMPIAYVPIDRLRLMP